MTISDCGIVLEIIGFIVLLLVSGRNPTQAHLLLNAHKDSPFDLIRQRIIPDRYVHASLIIGIALVIIGLVLQFSFLV